MRRIFKLLASFAGMFAFAVPAVAQPSVPLERSIDAYLAPLVRTNNFSGVVLVAKGDRIIFQKGYGAANVEHRVANTPATAFQIASISKPFTSAAVLHLVEQGKLSLTAPIARILPDYPGGERLTVHHLLTHTSGIPNINDFEDYAEIQRRPHRPETLVALFKDKPLEFAPGARYSYSNSNYNLLALIIEKVSGEEFGRFLERSIFRPLALDNTGHHGSASQLIDRLATGYAPAGSLSLERADYLDWSVKTGNGSLYSDAAGVMRFMRAVHQGKLLGPASLAASFTPHTPNVGYGWFLTKANNREIHHANGRSPGFAAQADYYVADQVAVVVLSNTYVSVTTPIARAIGAIYFGEPVAPMPALRSDPVAPATVAAIRGTYQFGPDYYVPNARIEVDAVGGAVKAVIAGSDYALVPIDDRHFLMRAFWVPTDFVIGADGLASEMSIDGFKGRRIR